MELNGSGGDKEDYGAGFQNEGEQQGGMEGR